MEKRELKKVSNKRASKKDSNIKKYIKDFFVFADNHLIKKIGLFIVLAILIVAISLGFVVSAVKDAECVGTCRDGVKLFQEYGSRMSVILFIGIAGVVPYMYVSIIGFAGMVISEATTLAYAIKGYGYVGGILAGIVPLLLNTITVSIVTALGIYICKVVTVGYKISNIKNMNAMNFRIRLNEVLARQKKVEELTKKKEEKLGRLEAKREKLAYLQILNTAIVVSIIQFVSVVIQHIVL